MAAINEEVAKRQDSELIRLARESYAMAMLDDGYKRPEILERTGVTLDESGKAVTAEGANTQTREAPADAAPKSGVAALPNEVAPRQGASIDQLIREGYDAPWRRDDSVADADDATSYIKRAGETLYFDMGNDWNKVQSKYNLSDAEMFEYFNKPVLNSAIADGKSIRFSHDPRSFRGGFLRDEWEYIKSKLHLTDSNLFFEGGFWYVK